MHHVFGRVSVVQLEYLRTLIGHQKAEDAWSVFSDLNLIERANPEDMSSEGNLRKELQSFFEQCVIEKVASAHSIVSKRQTKYGRWDFAFLQSHEDLLKILLHPANSAEMPFD